MPSTQLADDLKRYLSEREIPGDLGHILSPGSPNPSETELIRLSHHLKMDLTQAVVLVLKAQWETFQTKREGAGDARSQPHRPGLQREFQTGSCGTADASRLFYLFEEEFRLSGDSGHDEESFRTLVHHCTLLGLHLGSFHGPEVEAFEASQQTQQALLTGATPAERETFWIKHRQWREMEDEVGSLLLEVEGQSLENRRIERQWMETFGSAYLPLLEAESRFRSLERAIGRKLGNPHLTSRELRDLEASDLEGVEQEMARLRRTLARSRVAQLSGPGGMPLDDVESLSYEEECRSILREIYRLTHPDAVGQHGFTERQRERLLGHYREAVAFADTSRIEDEEIALGMRSLPSLEAILARVRKIWETEGLDVNEGAAICGDTLAERREWLEARIAELEEQARQVRADLLTLATDVDVGEKRGCLRSMEQITAIRGQMERKRQRYEEQIPALEARLQELFGGRSARDPTTP